MKINEVEYTTPEALNRISACIWNAILERNEQHPDLAIDVEAMVADDTARYGINSEYQLLDLLRILAIDQRTAIQVKEGNPPAYVRRLSK